jgi:hypothetical protein
MLRSIGHVFEKVDCKDESKRKAWAKAAWPKWKRDPIFQDFIEPARNQLLKEFSGGLALTSAGVSSPAFIAKGVDVGTVVAVDPDQLEDSAGRKVVELIHKAVEFWERVLPKTESDWGAP